tara:strand:- start:1420 stop:1668 length:249 start_codon:yes stop_codon:yes gene_type:complete
VRHYLSEPLRFTFRDIDFYLSRDLIKPILSETRRRCAFNPLIEKRRRTFKAEKASRVGWWIVVYVIRPIGRLPHSKALRSRL